MLEVTESKGCALSTHTADCPSAQNRYALLLSIRSLDSLLAAACPMRAKTMPSKSHDESWSQSKPPGFPCFETHFGKCFRSWETSALLWSQIGHLSVPFTESRLTAVGSLTFGTGTPHTAVFLLPFWVRCNSGNLAMSSVRRFSAFSRAVGIRT